MRTLRTKRDNQQWMLDLALNMRGRVQNFERDDWETPKRAITIGCYQRCGGKKLNMMNP